MNMFLPAEIVENYSNVCHKKATMPLSRLFPLAILAGMLIALGGAVTNTATHNIGDVGIARLISGLLFPFGLGMVILLGGELFTGNCLISIGVLEKKSTLTGMTRNLSLVFLGNFVGALLVAGGCAFFGQLNYSGGLLSLVTIKTAVSKVSMPFANAFVQGIFCNLLVSLGVLTSLAAKDVAGRILGAYIPVSFFVICGFPHCIADMFYIPAGIFALMNPNYALLATTAGVNVSVLNWGNYFLNSMIPVTLGNIVGGAGLGILLWFCYLRKAK